jgi:dTDP-4-amino-4,6-dideoxygalactose transaminase
VYLTVIVDADEFGLSRDQLYEALKAENVDTRRYYDPPLHQQKVYLDASAEYAGKLPHTESISSTALTLPMFSHMTRDQVGAVCDAIARLHDSRVALGAQWAESPDGG